MADSLRQVTFERLANSSYEVRNVRGGTIRVGSGGAETDFTPVELLLAAIAGCSAIDVDLITGKRGQPDRFDVHASGEKIRDEHGNRMTNLRLVFDVAFPEGEEGDAARDVLQSAIEKSRDRLCTVSRTLAVESPVEMFRRGAVS
jgi:putative redox protein